MVLPAKAIIIDDEEPGRNNLDNLIRKYCPEITVVGKAASGIEARLLLQQKPDLVFLDIEMPNENGIEWLQSLQPPPEHVIFVTAHAEYAIKAIKLAASDYLLKPVSIRELQTATEKVLRQLRIKPGTTFKQQPLSFNDDLNVITERISLPDTDGYDIVNKQNIIRLEADNNYTTVVTTGKKYLVSKTLKDFEEALNQLPFVRVHKTHIINLKHVVKVLHHDAVIGMADGSKISVSRRRYNAFLEALTLFAPMLK